MDYISLIIIALGLSMDAFAVAVCSGTMSKKISLRLVFKISMIFGFFQAVMPIIGWLVGKIAENIIFSVNHYIAFILLSYIGGKMLYDAIKEKKEGNSNTEKNTISNKTLLLLAIATSIDALATGVILPTTVGATNSQLMFTAVGVIGIITFVLSMLGVFIGKKFGDVLTYKASIFGGCILIVLGIKILIEGLFF